jgi:hypothetical protein
MKDLIFFFIISIFLSSSYIKAQLIFEENFSYHTGLIYTVSEGLWSELPSGNTDVEVIPGNLSYPGYASSGMGNYIFLDGGASGRSGIIRHFFTSLPNVYVSFLLALKDTLDLRDYSATGDYFFYLYNTTLMQFRGYIYIKKAASSGNIILGLSKAGGSPVYSSKYFHAEDTVLLVISYKEVAGNYNDSVRLWINPQLSDTEPLPDISTITGSDYVGATSVNFRQNLYSGNIYIDGVRAASNWGNAPLPVQLISFTAVGKKDKIVLNWKTETEVDNYGFDIERKIHSKYKNEDWKKIGFIEGHGNCNAPRFYSFTDNEVYNLCTYLFRLKQINGDGNYIYSHEVEVLINNPVEFKLNQNFPNPFNPSTTISFSLSSDNYINLSIYTILGEKKEDIINSYLHAGDYELKYNADALSSGVYLCVLQSGNTRRTVKLLISR